ncbi:hypothetical protein AKG11_00205 [Shinella sp. SUS2]|nr:hypothetical protein AKG11_00205 [Shinella sp. SUS2]KOC76436.1 hypothetical protein AKG10_05655 [Shinella sp. GWS1]
MSRWFADDAFEGAGEGGLRAEAEAAGGGVDRELVAAEPLLGKAHAQGEDVALRRDARHLDEAFCEDRAGAAHFPGHVGKRPVPAGLAVQRRNDAAEARVAQRLDPARRIAAAALHPATHDGRGDHVGKAREDAGRAHTLLPHFPFHGIEQRHQFGLPADQRADRHDRRHEADQRVQRVEFELHAAGEDQRIVFPVGGLDTGLHRCHIGAERLSRVTFVVTDLDVRSGDDLVHFAARQKHGITAGEFAPDLARRAQQDLAAGDEMEAGFRPRRKADAEGWAELEPAVAGTAQAHAHQEFADGIMLVFLKAGRLIKHCG